MKRAGFTMIELIFVIVILGILAAVAIPKLAATRQDAEATAALATWKTAINQIQSDTMAQGAVPADFTTIVDGGANLVVAATSITATATVGGTADTTCAVGSVDANDTFTIDVQAQTDGCVLFADMVDTTVQLTGTSVSR